MADGKGQTIAQNALCRAVDGSRVRFEARVERTFKAAHTNVIRPRDIMRGIVMGRARIFALTSRNPTPGLGYLDCLNQSAQVSSKEVLLARRALLKHMRTSRPIESDRTSRHSISILTGQHTNL